jgi:hypothetical protein
MMLSAAVLSLVLAQTPAPADPAPAPAEPAPAQLAPVGDADAGASAGGTPTYAPRAKGADEAAKLLKKWGELKPAERLPMLEQVQKQYGQTGSNPVLPPPDFDFDKYTALTAIDQARITARDFFSDLVTNDTTGLLAHSGFPFMLEDRRFERPEDLRHEWLKSLRSKRTDLLKLYEVEVLTPTDMEKKYGPPPRRLASWNWRGSNTYLAVANLSGHAAIVMLKPVGAAWQVVAYHD